MSLRFGLLGLLQYAPMSGYDLKGIFDNSVKFFWSAETSQIYRELKALERSKFVKSSMEKSHTGPNRKVYRVTELGAKALKKWLLDTNDEAWEDNRNEFLLRVFLSSSVGGNELLGMLERRLEKYQRDLKALQGLGPVMESYRDRIDVDKAMLFWKISASRGIYDVQSHIAWAEENIKLLQDLGFRSGKGKS